MASDHWASGAIYEPYVGRWSRLVAREFVAWLQVPEGVRWLDVGCGTGALTQAVLDAASPSGVKGIDPSGGFVQYARSNIADARAEFQVGEAEAIPEDANSYGAAVCGLVLNFVKRPAVGLHEMKRVTVQGGVVGVYVWDYAGEMQLMRQFWDAAIALDPSAVDVDEATRFPICRPEPLADLFAEAGLGDVQVRAIDVPTVFKDFGDYWKPFLGGQAPAPAYAMSLSEERRAALRDHIHARLPVEPDGSIHLIARAWAAKGTVGRE